MLTPLNRLEIIVFFLGKKLFNEVLDPALSLIKNFKGNRASEQSPVEVKWKGNSRETRGEIENCFLTPCKNENS